MKQRRGDILVIGVGNADRGDDAVGLRVAQRIKEKAPDGVRILEHHGEGAALIESWKGAEAVMVVDAVSSGARPGTIHRFDAGTGALPAACFRGSTHAFSLPDAIELARALRQLPPRLRVYGIEGERFQLGTGLTSTVAKAAGKVAREIRKEIHHA
jgi:hydrogenase maturation protease